MEVLTCPRVRDAPSIGVPMRRSHFGSRPTALGRSMGPSGLAIRPFVLSCASVLPLAGWASATRTLRVLVQIALWAVGEGIALDRELVFDPDTVERFVAASPGSDASRATYRAVLRRIGPLLTRKAPWEPRKAACEQTPGGASRTREKNLRSCPTMRANSPLKDSAERLVP